MTSSCRRNRTNITLASTAHKDQFVPDWRSLNVRQYNFRFRSNRSESKFNTLPPEHVCVCVCGTCTRNCTALYRFRVVNHRHLLSWRLRNTSPSVVQLMLIFDQCLHYQAELIFSHSRIRMISSDCMHKCTQESALMFEKHCTYTN